MKIIIAGSRTIKDRRLFASIEASLPGSVSQVTEVVCGDCYGPDKIGELWAKANGIPVEHFPAEWTKYGDPAGPIRNRKMAEYADFLIAFHDGRSRGTQSIIENMQRLGKPVHVNYCMTDDVTTYPKVTVRA